MKQVNEKNWLLLKTGAGNEIRTRDLNLGKIGFYYVYHQLPKCPYYLTGNVFSNIIEYKIEYVKLEWHVKWHQFNCQLPP